MDYGDSDDSSDDDEIQYCDCVAAALQQSLPGTPGRKGIITLKITHIKRVWLRNHSLHVNL